MCVCVYIYVCICCMIYMAIAQGYGSLPGRMEIWNKGVAQMNSDEYSPLTRVWIRDVDRLCIGVIDRGLTF